MLAIPVHTDIQDDLKEAPRVLTFANGGRAKFSDKDGVTCESWCWSACEYPSSSNAGRLYWATKVSMIKFSDVGSFRECRETAKY